MQNPKKQCEAPKEKRRRLRANAAKSKVACNIGKMALEQLPGVAETLSEKVKNKRLKKKKKKKFTNKKYLLSKNILTIKKILNVKKFFTI